MNSRGQVLVMFIMVLPILFVILTLVAEMGYMHIEKKNISSNTYTAVEYYLENLDDLQIDNKVRLLLNKNINDIDDIEIKNTDDYVEISVTKKYKGIYNKILDDNEIIITYRGLKKNNKIIKG